MRIMMRNPGVLDGIITCADCGGPMIKVGIDYRCMQKTEPEELAAVGLIPSKDPAGKVYFDLSAKDQQSIQATQALSGSVEIDNAYLEKMGLNLQKVREYQIKHKVLP
jgi:hypothetical protein